MSQDVVAFIDWISYTRMNDGKKLDYPSDFTGASREVVWEWQKTNARSMDVLQETLWVKPNRPFRDARMDAYTKSRIEWGGGSDRVLISFSGEGCRFLRTMGRTQDLLGTIAGEVTRIDLSVDIRTGVSPFDFAGKRDKERHKNGALMFSEEGQTQYVGSWSGDRFARVYRYNPPHERSEFLRVEHVFKGRQAKILAAKLVHSSPSALLAACGDVYGWAHSLWENALGSAENPESVDWYKAEKKASKTLLWLEGVCAPALCRMVREGEIVDLDRWLADNVYDMIWSEEKEARSDVTTGKG